MRSAPRSGTNAQLGNDPFFIAWTQGSFSGTPIQTQVISGLDTREFRQYTGGGAGPDVLAFASANPGKLYIAGDEPDQACIAPSDYAVTYHDFVSAIRGADPTALVSPAGVGDPNDQCCPVPGEPCRSNMHYTGYMDQFYNAYIQRYGVAPPVNEWRFHNFAQWIGTGDVNTWWTQISNAAAWSVSHGANMVLGSWGFLGWNESASAYQAHLRQTMDLLLNDGRINQAAYWSYENTGYPHYLVNADGTLTPEGQTYASPPAALSAIINGSSNVAPRQFCTWTTAVSGGASPYQYAWTANGQPVGHGTSTLSYGNNGSPFTLAVTITDQYGAVKGTAKSVNTQTGGHC